MACARGGGHGCRLKEGGGVWEMDTCDRTYVWSHYHDAVISVAWARGYRQISVALTRDTAVVISRVNATDICGYPVAGNKS